MKKMILVLLVGISVFLASSYGADKTLLDQANQSYRQGNYVDAYELYKTIASEHQDPLLYYNFANSAYKIGDVANAVLYYEKALKIRPLFKDAAFNLRVVRHTLLDKERMDDNPFVKAASSFAKSLPLNILLVVLSVIFFIFILYLFFHSFGRFPRVTNFVKPFMKYLIVLILLVTSLLFVGLSHLNVVKEAVVMGEEVSLKVMPHEKADEVFKLHKGAKIRIIDVDGDWVNIRFGKDKEGKDLEAWIEKRFLETI